MMQDSRAHDQFILAANITQIRLSEMQIAQPMLFLPAPLMRKALL
jgi:hypothetical protein